MVNRPDAKDARGTLLSETVTLPSRPEQRRAEMSATLVNNTLQISGRAWRSSSSTELLS